MVIDPCLGITEATIRARRGAKWTKFGSDVLGAWVADMDFPAPQPVLDAVASAAAQSALGYECAEDTQALFEAASRWLATRHGWAPDPSTFVALTELVQGLIASVYAFSEPGDGVIVQGPIYPPFLTSITALGRRVVDNRLVDACGVAALDLDSLRRLAADPRTRLLLLCNPHNPSGRVLRREELEAIAAIAIEHDLVVVADEVWMDIVYRGHRHIPFATLGEDVARRTVTLTSAGKTFNIAGLRCAVAIFGSPELRARFDALPARIRGSVSVLGLRGSVAAWTAGGPWLDAVLRQLHENRDLVAAFVRERLTGVRHRTPEGTYLAWLDFSALHLDRPAAAFLLERAGVALNDGNDFGGDSHCARLNFATTPAILQEILGRVERAVCG
jgi:cystathionine beta-lyase